MTKYKVTYPLITMDASRLFDTRDAADAFANERRNFCSQYQSIHAWRRVKVEAVECEPVKLSDIEIA